MYYGFSRIRLVHLPQGPWRDFWTGELAGGSWLPLPLILDLAFRDEQESTWQEAVRSLGGEGRDLAGMPPDIRWN